MSSAWLACVQVPCLPWQLQLRRQPSWQAQPGALVQVERPQAPLLWCNRAARARQLMPGLRLAQARAACAELNIGVVTAAELIAAQAELLALLAAHSPVVAADAGSPGCLWLDARGLTALLGPLDAWSQEIVQTLARQRLQACVRVGFNRQHLRALCSVGRGALILASAAEERQQAASTPLQRLDWPAPWLHDLEQLGIQHWGAFLRLAATDVRRRWGAAAAALHAEAHSDQPCRLQPERPPQPAQLAVTLEQASACAHRLLFACKSLLDAGLQLPQLRGQAVATLALTLELEARGAAPICHILVPARPSREAYLLLELVRLRLQAQPPPSAVSGLQLQFSGADSSGTQLQLAIVQPRRDVDAAARALSKLVALWGETAVGCAELQALPLPEARFSWRHTVQLQTPQPPTQTCLPPLLRRMFWPPRPLPLSAARLAPGQDLGRPYGRLERLWGPYAYSSHWWAEPSQRLYFYLRSDGGYWLFVFFDARARRWFVQGEVD